MEKQIECELLFLICPQALHFTLKICCCVAYKFQIFVGNIWIPRGMKCYKCNDPTGFSPALFAEQI